MMPFIPGSRRPRFHPPSESHPAATPPTSELNLLDSLPREQLDEIIRRLSIKDAIRTSTLAKDWRNHWKVCPGLHLVFFSDDPLGVVDLVLSQYTCYVEVFEVHFTKESFSMLEGWFHALANKGVGSIELYFVPATFWEQAIVPNSLFMCHGVTKLVLQFCKIPALSPTFQGFPQLKHLEIYEVTFPKNGERTFEALITMSPSLKILSIHYPMFEGHENSHVYSEWVIHAPKVEELVIRSGDDFGWKIIDLPSLVEAEVQLEGSQITRILSGITRVQKLYMDFIDDTILEHLPSYYVDLKYLSFHTTFTQSSRLLSIFCILRNAPNLECLQIMILQDEDEYEDGDIEVDKEFLNAQPSIGELANYEKASLQAKLFVSRFEGYYINDGETESDDKELEIDDKGMENKEEGLGTEEELKIDEGL
ncbi:hypothetical protein QOZ80_1AG0021460 [Eleusine coracana subsp. coracana]|nr:hypothetical protein QOZ80_1AG0021460 [Eleusine coracana subsp. coracana]